MHTIPQKASQDMQQTRINLSGSKEQEFLTGKGQHWAPIAPNSSIAHDLKRNLEVEREERMW